MIAAGMDNKENFIISEGIKIWTIQTGQGFPVMLCNGGPGCCDYLEPVAQMLADTTTVIRFEQRGGRRSEPQPPYNTETCLAGLEKISTHYNLERRLIGGRWSDDDL